MNKFLNFHIYGSSYLIHALIIKVLDKSKNKHRWRFRCLFEKELFHLKLKVYSEMQCFTILFSVMKLWNFWSIFVFFFIIFCISVRYDGLFVSNDIIYSNGIIPSVKNSLYFRINLETTNIAKFLSSSGVKHAHILLVKTSPEVEKIIRISKGVCIFFFTWQYIYIYKVLMKIL